MLSSFLLGYGECGMCMKTKRSHIGGLFSLSILYCDYGINQHTNLVAENRMFPGVRASWLVLCAGDSGTDRCAPESPSQQINVVGCAKATQILYFEFTVIGDIGRCHISLSHTHTHHKYPRSKNYNGAICSALPLLFYLSAASASFANFRLLVLPDCGVRILLWRGKYENRRETLCVRSRGFYAFLHWYLYIHAFDHSF